MLISYARGVCVCVCSIQKSYQKLLYELNESYGRNIHYIKHLTLKSRDIY